jgi:cyclopropane-fatty-acyl-phospholipid synthase
MNKFKKISKVFLYIFAIILLVIIIIIFFAINTNPKKIITKIINENTNLSIVNSGECGDIIVRNPIMFQKIIRKGEFGLAESYIDGDWDSSNLEKIFLELNLKHDYLINAIKKQLIYFLFSQIKFILINFKSNNTISSSKKNISYHYDIGNNLYTKMLGKTMQYTCAYFYKPNMTLDQAQIAKMELIAKKLNLKKGLRVLDIGCGFGAMAYFLARNFNVIVTGVTISKEQKEYADKNYKHHNLKIELKDYRNVNGKFDRIYSVGMFEHVGRKNYHEYYNKCYELLEDDGIMLLHTIGTKTRKWNFNSFINKYIFPEGELPNLESITKEFSDKWYLEDLHNFGISYSKTLRNWRKNIGNWKGLEKYDNKFRRMWDYYLYGCAAAFQTRCAQLWQLVYVKVCTTINDNLHYIRNCR